jgi:2-oxo-4-hydroxy-4-carboxy--5-ureidoimidazoline (OHCU) decarboxylase
MHMLDQLNAVSRPEVVAALDGVFEHAPWGAEAVAPQRSFFSVIRLHDALMAAVRAAVPPSRPQRLRIPA